jgi:enterochelin esterase-like enzyme
MASLFNHDALEAAYHGGLPATRGEWRTISFFSRALGREVSYMAWLPPGYTASGQTYPTLYLLHGVGSAEAYGVEEWLGYALTEDLDRMLALGLIEPMIVILPNGDQGYWINQANGGPQWADFVAKDLVTHVDATFRTTATRETRAIGGLSMGGHGALQITYNHPELFSVAGAHSPTIRPFETSPEFFGDQAHFAQYDPISLAKSASKPAQRVLTWIDVGANDKWRSGAEQLAAVLTAQRAPVQFRVIEGEHEGWYWEYYLPEYLYFYSNALHTAAKSAAGAPVVESNLLTAAGVPANAL